MSNLPQMTLIKAGAGAGKTYKIQQTLTQWIEQGKVQANRILAVTFTHAAANEMRSRIRQQLITKGLRQQAEALQNAHISTIHQFGLSLIQQFAYELGSSPHPRQLTEAEGDQIIRQTLNQVKGIEVVLEDLEHYGFKKRLGRDDRFIESAEALKNKLLHIIKDLRSLGKFSKGEDEETLVDLVGVLAGEIQNIYGLTTDADTLEKALWHAIEQVQQQYPDKATLMEAWGSNPASRSFVEAIYQATPEKLKNDWKLWVKLQTIKAPKIEKHADLRLAESIWESADKLCRHPGPREEATQKMTILLLLAMETLEIYQQAKQKAGLIDFNDMVQQAWQILQTPEFLQEAAQNYDCLIIDEFQDTNPLQFALLKRFSDAGIPTLIVGDIKQSIMGFQGSDERLFKQLLQEGEADNTIMVEELKNNWRSTPEMMAFINQLGTALYDKAYQPLTVTPEASYTSVLCPVKVLDFKSDTWQAGARGKKHDYSRAGQYALAHYIKEMLESGVEVTDRHTKQKRPIRPSDIAVLAHRHKALGVFSAQLKKLGVASKVQQAGLIESEAVQWVLNALTYAANPSDKLAMLKLLTSSFGQVPLQAALENHLKDRRFQHPIEEILRQTAAELQQMDAKSALIKVMALLEVEQKLKTHPDFQQQRANLLKLIQLGESFNETQPESLQAMGIFGKNLHTFLVWIQQNLESNPEGFDQQPAVELQAEDAVVLSTWHASKGLEWPVVMVLEVEKDLPPKLPSQTMAYQATELDQMLEKSYLQLFPEFKDPKTKEKFLKKLRLREKENLRNLAYVVFTRAREQVIIPWFKTQKAFNLQAFLTNELERPSFEIQRQNMVAIDEEEAIERTQTTTVVKAVEVPTTERIPAVVSPSQIHGSTQKSETQKRRCAELESGLDLTPWDQQLSANEIGTRIHRLLEVQFTKPQLLESAIQQIAAEESPEFKTELVEFCQKTQSCLQNWLPNAQWQCEVPILTQVEQASEQTQILNGTIDLLAETEAGYWIIDYKTDKTPDFNQHAAQLQAYAQALGKMNKPVLGVVIYWVRSTELEVLSLTF